MTKVLVPFDFSDQAQHALDFTLALGENLDNLEVEVLHVMETPSFSSLGTMGGGVDLPNYENQIYFIELTERRKKQMADLEAKYQEKSFKLQTKIKLGNAFQGISESINEENPDLVIMGSKGATGIEEVLIGSNTEKVVRSSKCPVLTVKAAINPSHIDKIVFASDFREDSEETAKNIKRLQKLFDAELYLVNVNTPGSFETTRDSIARIKHFVKKFEFENVKAEIYNSTSEEAGIIEFAEDIDADLIAMATHGRTGFLHLITGSIAEDVVNHAKRLVWTFRAD
ncbi:universal stress protein [Algoriphagus vanfongensis]|uniref:universal stress protein n=1 Tax=Algoriphagus vanfongensis TaxID=426371 RepID=UPI00041ED89B|nr:universal stress protein [Algoriphagus vanfongensis]